jgi:uncharacterized repeat protein (TIGR03803 family)
MKIRLPGNLLFGLLAICLSLTSVSSEAQGVYRFWGVTRQGGQNNTGVLFSLDSNANNYQVHHDFVLSNPGAAPYYTHLTEFNGKYYGVTLAGGDNNNYGVIFEWDPVTNVYSKKYDFSGDDAWFAYGSLTVLNNKLYGMTNRGGDHGLGVIFEFDPQTDVFNKLFHFSDNTGHSPEGSLTAYNGVLYGTTRSGGDHFGGTLFQFDPQTLAFDKKVDFGDFNGKYPAGQMVVVNNKLFGMTTDGGAQGKGAIFEFDPSNNNYSKRFSFDGSNGKYPYGSLTYFQNKLYGMTTEGGQNNAGVLFEFDPANFACINKISFGGSNGVQPYGSLAAGINTLAGMTWMGGQGNFGVLFEYDPATASITHTREFANSQQGANPLGSLVWNGTHFVGMTTSGGASNSGVIFEWNPTTDSYTKKIDFNLAENGSLPEGNLLEWKGKLYGASSRGGAFDRGTLYSYDQTSGSFTRLLDFEGSNGAYPTGDLAIFNGKIYGWTREGGDNNRGSIFTWDLTTQQLQLVYSFQSATGQIPSRGPVLWNGKFYGTTEGGGSNDLGTIYSFDPATAQYSKQHDFDDINGAMPAGNLAIRSGIFYGMTTDGGSNGTGTIYQWDPVNNIFTSRYSFEVTGEGVHPRAGLTLSANGSVFYGMTRMTNGQISFPGQEGPGVLFEWNPGNGQYTRKIDFDGSNGGLPVGNLSYSGGKYYGMTSQGGNGESYPGINIIVGGSGVIFEWDAANNIIDKKVDLLGDNGAYPSTNNLGRTKVPVAIGTDNNCKTVPSVIIDGTNNNKWVAITDEDGNVVAEINAQGNNLGAISTSFYINSGAIREDNRRRLYLDRDITIVPAVQPTSPVAIRLYLRGNEWQALKAASNSMGQPSGVNQIGDLAIYKLNTICGDVVTELANRHNSVGEAWSADYVLTTTVTSFSTFYFASANPAEAPLPVEFVSFTATLQNEDGLLDWKTQYEEAIARFEIQRSIDGQNFETIGLANPHNSSGSHHYQFRDSKITSLGLTRVFYRIREVSVDGQMLYSPSAMLNLPAMGTELVFYPNPVKADGNLRIQWNRSEAISARLLDQSGRQLRQYSWTLQPGRNQYPVSLNGMGAGYYLLEIRGAGWSKVLRIVKE